MNMVHDCILWLLLGQQTHVSLKEWCMAYIASRMSISDGENVVKQATGRYRHRQLIQQETRQQ